jgi:hypothetical protein
MSADDKIPKLKWSYAKCGVVVAKISMYICTVIKK